MVELVNNLDDTQLVACAQKGNKRAFDELVKRYYKWTRRMLYEMLPRDTQQEVHDTAQKVWISLSQGLHKLGDFKGSFAAVVRVYAEYEVKHVFKHKQVMNKYFDYDTTDCDWENFCAQFDPLETLIFHETALQVRLAILEIDTATLRKVAYLRIFEQMSYNDIAELLQKPAGTIEGYMVYARRQLQHILADSFDYDVSKSRATYTYIDGDCYEEIQRRAQAGESPSKLAKEFNISRTHVYRIKKGIQRKKC